MAKKEAKVGGTITTTMSGKKASAVGSFSYASIIWVMLLALFVKLRIPHLLPFGPAVPVDKKTLPVFADVDPDNKSLHASSGKLRKIIERVPDRAQPLLVGPETVVIDPHGQVCALTEQSKLVCLSDFEDEPGESIFTTAKATEIVHLGVGRPLGGKFTPDGKILYVADCLMGLLRVRFDTPQDKNGERNGGDTPKSTSKPIVELVASQVKLQDGTWSRILFADDVDIGPKTGHVYFSDASDIPPIREDALQSSKLVLLKGEKTGRLLRYKPETDEVDILASNIWFANGISVDEDETFVAIAETFGARVLKYHLAGPRKGMVDVMTDALPGFVDGVDCSKSSRLCYAALPSSKPPAMAVFNLPAPIDQYVRTLLMMLPSSLSPKVVPYGGVAEIFPGDEQTPSRVTRILQDPNGQDIQFITGVTEYGGKLYLGFLEHNHIGVYDLS